MNGLYIQMNNYQNSIIYKIICKDKQITNKYISSTTNLNRRISDHIRNCNNINSKNYNQRLYNFIRANGGWNKWDIIIIEKYPTSNLKELKKRTKYHIDEIGASLNKQTPNRIPKKYYDNLFYLPISYEDNNYKEICECGTILLRYSLPQHLTTKKHQRLLNLNIIKK